jgi:hypothetical protein
MNTNTLVGDLIEGGKRIVDQLPQDGFEVTAAFWLKQPKTSNGISTSCPRLQNLNASATLTSDFIRSSCEYRTDSQHPDRIVFSPRGVMFRDGATRPTFDLILRQR